MAKPTDPRDDPRPQPPEKPLPTDCCGSGCPVCVLDVYDAELARYLDALEAWEARHPTPPVQDAAP